MSYKAILSLGLLLAAITLVSSGVMATESTRTSSTAMDTYNEVAIKDLMNEASREGDKYEDGKWFWKWWPYFHYFKGFGYEKGWHFPSEKRGYEGGKGEYFNNKVERINVDDAYQLPYTPSKGEKANIVALNDMTNEVSGDDGKYLDAKWPGWKWWKGFGSGQDYHFAGRKGGYFDKMGEKMDVGGASAAKPLN